MSRNTTPWEEYEQESCLFSTVGGEMQSKQKKGQGDEKDGAV